MRARGFSLIELILFVSVVGVLMVGLMPLLQNVLGSVQTSQQATQGLFLAQERLEQMIGAYRVGAGFDGVTEAAFPDEAGIALGNGPVYNRDVVVEGASIAGQTLTCNGGAYVSGNYKCVSVRIRDQRDRVVAQVQTVMVKF
ncbi:MAG: type II secretion system protein [Magnetococcales bacterium]|nr:type II secretion system protein [Magnetococcales bacterium]